MANYIYTRPTYSVTGDAQNKAILAHFNSKGIDCSPTERYAENRLKMGRFQAMLDKLQDGDYVLVYTPAVLGIGIESCIDSIGKVYAKGARIESVKYGEIDEEFTKQIAVAGDIVREAFEIERYDEMKHQKGVRAFRGGYFEDGVWHTGKRKVVDAPYWAFITNRSKYQVDVAKEMREGIVAKWIDRKIAKGWTTERIWEEYQDLKRVMPEDMWDSIGKQWINKRRLELIK